MKSLLPYLAGGRQRGLADRGCRVPIKTICLHPRLSRNSPLPWPLPWLHRRPGVQFDESHSAGRSRWGKKALELVRPAVPSSSLEQGRGRFVLSFQPSRRRAALCLTLGDAKLLGCLVRLPNSQEGISWPWLQVQRARIVRTLRFEYLA